MGGILKSSGRVLPTVSFNIELRHAIQSGMISVVIFRLTCEYTQFILYYLVLPPYLYVLDLCIYYIEYSKMFQDLLGFSETSTF